MRTLAIAFLLTSVCLAVGDAIADSKSAIATVERMPRGNRLAAYERALADPKLLPKDRVELIRAFARHAKDVSPVYSKERFPFSEQKWIATLRQGFAGDSSDLDIAQALAQLLVDRRDHKAAQPVLEAMKKTHSENHFAAACLAWCEAQSASTDKGPAVEPLSFPVHFCVLTRNEQAHRVATQQQCRKECDILNATFRSLDGEQLAHFEFKGYSAFDDIKGTGSELLDFGDRTTEYDTELVAKAFNASTDPKVRDRQAINFYIYDAHSAKERFADTTSHGKRNSNRPFVLIDWQRLNNAGQNAEAHEMGHAFGLEHVGVLGASEKSSTNIMASIGEQFGSGGRRDLGFSVSQAALILHHAKRTKERLAAAR